MKNLQINEPCTEDWALMTPTEKGAFCQKCEKQVIDFTSKSNLEIKDALMNFGGGSVCGRIRVSQLDAFNAEAEAWQLNASRQFQSTLMFSMVVVFGLTLFSCSSRQEEKTILKMQETIGQIISQPEEVRETILQTTQEKQVAAVKNIVSSEESAAIIEDTEEVADSLYEVLDEINLSADFGRNDYVIKGSMTSVRYYDCGCTPNSPDEYDENGVLIPKVFQSKAYPNPVISNTTLEIGLPFDDLVEINLFDLSGKFIQPVFSGELKRGTHGYSVEMLSLPAGTYIFTIRSKNYSGSVKVMKV